jgi:hypothetical protein
MLAGRLVSGGRSARRAASRLLPVPGFADQAIAEIVRLAYARRAR